MTCRAAPHSTSARATATTTLAYLEVHGTPDTVGGSGLSGTAEMGGTISTDGRLPAEQLYRLAAKHPAPLLTNCLSLSATGPPTRPRRCGPRAVSIAELEYTFRRFQAFQRLIHPSAAAPTASPESNSNDAESTKKKNKKGKGDQWHDATVNPVRLVDSETGASVFAQQLQFDWLLRRVSASYQ
ncbi:hypothetical protein HK405_000117 [Cladochytrium tenue]|nr:hypothetical protein HK405_000117 [Cladochytrium tenue]